MGLHATDVSADCPRSCHWATPRRPPARCALRRGPRGSPWSRSKRGWYAWLQNQQGAIEHLHLQKKEKHCDKIKQDVLATVGRGLAGAVWLMASRLSTPARHPEFRNAPNLRGPENTALPRLCHPSDLCMHSPRLSMKRGRRCMMCARSEQRLGKPVEAFRCRECNFSTLSTVAREVACEEHLG